MHTVVAARPLALVCFVFAIALSLLVDAPVPRTMGLALAFLAAWVLYELAARARAARGEEGWQGDDRRRNPLLRTLTDQMLVHVREMYRTAEAIREGTRSRAEGEAAIDRLERDMVELVRKMKRSATLQYETRAGA